MKQRIIISVVLATLLLGSGETIRIEAKDNVFQRGVSAVRNFFGRDKKENVESVDSIAGEQRNISNAEEKEGRHKKRTQKEPTFASREAELQYIYGLSLDENVKFPSAGKHRAAVHDYQQTQAKRLIAAGETVETMRGGEVVICSISSDDLFLPNDTVLRPTAGKYLRPYLTFLKSPDMYRMLLAMHSDDTGSVAYTDALTNSRVLAVLKWFQEHAASSDYVIPYGMGASEPLYENNSVEKRSKNRRLEIYLVPGRMMLRLASQGQLH